MILSVTGKDALERGRVVLVGILAQELDSEETLGVLTGTIVV